MEWVSLYKCLGDIHRLRILNLLCEGPLCVCHLQEILDENQVKTSKQLRYMRKTGVVAVRREGSWMINSIAKPMHPLIRTNIAFIQSQRKNWPVFRADLDRRAELVSGLLSGCPSPETLVNGYREAAAGA